MKKELEKIDWKKILRALKIPIVLILYGWIGVILLGLWIKILTELYPSNPHPFIEAMTRVILFAIPVLIWLYTWRKIAKYYRDKYIK